ncbi:hypothetical protein Acr_00g0022380 [Actinidia rufa]|uniref:non-specific serine/threonine protein kinase n=1 Tax=Actinidia rufa TaxID=165716 RepID=A0A7J0DCU1_9ERIC|nr:hypothetical protein Acr_00g0022380 [Actinidia rufa]
MPEPLYFFLFSISFLTKPHTALITHQDHPPSTIISKLMNSKLFIIPTILIIFIATSQTCHGQIEEQYYNCTSNYTCGQVARNLSYPFWGGNRPQYCGHPAFELKCQDDEYPTLNIGNRDYRLLGVNQSSYRISIARLDLWESYCTKDLSDVALTSDSFQHNEMVRGLFIFYNCTRAFPNFTCNVDGRESGGFYEYQLSSMEEVIGLNSSCSQRIVVLVMRAALNELLSKTLTLQDVLKMGFEVQYDAENTDCSRCEGSGGICGYHSSRFEFICHCRDGPCGITCSNPGTNRIPFHRRF